MVLLLSATYCLSFIDRYMLILMVQPIKADLGLSDTQVGLVTGLAFGLFYAVAHVPMGRLADRTSRRGLIAAGVFIWSAMTALCGLASSFATLFVGRMGLGLGEAALLPGGVSLIADYFPPARRGRAVGFFMMGASIGSGLAIMVGGAVVALASEAPDTLLPLVGTVRPWQLAFLCVGVPGMAFSLLFLAVPEPARRAADTESADDGGQGLSAFVRRHRMLLALHVVAMCACSACSFGFVAWTPALLMRVFGWSAGQIGLTYGPVAMLASSSGMFLGGWLSDRRVRRGEAAAPIRVATLGLLMLAITTPLSTQLGNVWATLAMMGVVTFTIAVPYGVSMTGLLAITPNTLRGTISAIYMFCTSVAGFGIGPTAVGWMSDHLFTQVDGLRDAISVLGLATAPLAAAAMAVASVRYRGVLKPGEGCG